MVNKEELIGKIETCFNESVQKEKEKNYIIRINGIKFDNTLVNKTIAEAIKTYYNSKGYDDVIIEEVKETQ